MDIYVTETTRHRDKRPRLTTMAQAGTLSPAPFDYASRPPSLHNDEIPLSYERRRRTLHPHNHSQGPRRELWSPAEIVSDGVSSSQGLPALEHRTSQTIVDLTEDLDEPLQRRRSAMPPPPRFSRSDSQALAEIVDLTADDDDDLIITESRAVEQPRQASQPQSAFFRRRPHLAEAWHQALGRVDAARPGDPRGHIPPLDARGGSPPLFVPQEPRGHGLFMQQIQHVGGRIHQYLRTVAVAPHMEIFNNFPEAPLDYDMIAFQAQGQREPLRPPKPSHVPPPAVPEGFTRSPVEDHVVICPSCEEELIAHKVDGNIVPPTANGKKPKTAKPKDTAEHPFWVIKECGHVYCNNCFQNRTAKASTPPTTFGTKTGTSNRPTKTCAVDDCDAEVSASSKWVGVYL